MPRVCWAEAGVAAMPNSRIKQTALSLRLIFKIIDEYFIGRSPFRAAHVMTIDLRLDALTDASNQTAGRLFPPPKGRWSEIAGSEVDYNFAAALATDNPASPVLRKW